MAWGDQRISDWMFLIRKVWDWHLQGAMCLIGSGCCSRGSHQPTSEDDFIWLETELKFTMSFKFWWDKSYCSPLLYSSQVEPSLDTSKWENLSDSCHNYCSSWIWVISNFITLLCVDTSRSRKSWQCQCKTIKTCIISHTKTISTSYKNEQYMLQFVKWSFCQCLHVQPLVAVVVMMGATVEVRSGQVRHSTKSDKVCEGRRLWWSEGSNTGLSPRKPWHDFGCDISSSSTTRLTLMVLSEIFQLLGGLP